MDNNAQGIIGQYCLLVLINNASEYHSIVTQKGFFVCSYFSSCTASMTVTLNAGMNRRYQLECP